MLKSKKSPLFMAMITALSTQVVSADTIIDKTKDGNTFIKIRHGVRNLNISTPNNDGVSMNYFKEFNVEGKGTIINNSSVDYNSILDGRIKGNPNLKQREADVAVMNVTGSKKTQLLKKLEAATDKKNFHVYIANENGILVDGASFENIQKLTLATGKVNKKLITDVKGGEVVISGKGLKGIKNLNIFAESLQNSGKIAAGEKITAILGHNTIDKDGRVIFTPSRFYVKSTNLGRMYADQIKIKATSGASINIDELLAKNNIDLQAETKIVNKGNIKVADKKKGKIKIKARNFDNVGQVQFNKDSYDLKWLTRDGKVVDVDFIKNEWNKKHTKQLTSKDTWLLMTGTLLNQWTYDKGTYEKDGSIVKNFKKFLTDLNMADKNTVLSKEGLDLVSQKQRKSEFVNKGDIYATETDDKRILEAVAISKQKAKQAVVSANTVVIEIDELLKNKDAVISAKDELKITAKKIINENSVSGDILLQDGYENISWEVMPIYVKKRKFWTPWKFEDVVADATYDLAYDRGLVDKDSARKTKVTAVNTSKIKGKKVTIKANNVDFKDEINTGVAVEADTLTIDAGNLNIKGQELKAKDVILKGKNAQLDSALIQADNADINVDNVSLNMVKTKETVLKTDKEHLTREVGSGSGIIVKDSLNLTAKNVKLASSILKAKDLNITADKVDNDSSYLEKDYKSSYEISKTFRKIKHNEKTQVNAPSVILAENLEINAKDLNTHGSHVAGSKKVTINSKVTKVDVATVKNELDKKVGIDNGILGENYKKVKKHEKKNIGSVIESEGEIAAKIAKELIVIGSKIKGSKVKVEAENVTIANSKDESKTETDKRFILAGEELSASAEFDDVSAKIDMEIAKKEHVEENVSTSKNSSIEGKKVEVTAKENLKVEGSDIKGDDVKLKGKKVEVTDSKDTVKIKKEGVTAQVNSEFGLKDDTVSATVTTTVEHKKENIDSESSNSSNIEGKKVEITADDVTVTGSNITGDTDITATNQVTIQHAENSSKYEKDSEKLILGMGGEVKSSVIELVSMAKKLVDEREQLLGYVLNPIAGVQKAKEVKQKLEKNVNDIKKLVSDIKANNVDPESLGIAVNVKGDISLNKQYIAILNKKVTASNITGGKVNISTGTATIQGSNVTADNVTINADQVNVISAEDKKDAYEVNANVGVETTANIVTETVTANVTAGVNHKQNHTKDQVASKIEAGNVDINAKKDINVGNSTITAETGSVNAGGDINLISKSDVETNFGIGANGKVNPETGEGKLDVATKVEHKQEVNTVASVNVDNVSGNIKKQDDAKVNLEGHGGISTDGHGATGNLGLSTEIEKKTEHTDGKYVVGVDGKLNVDENGQLNDSNLAANVAGDVTIIAGKDVPVKDTNVHFEGNANVNNAGVVGGNVASAVTTTIAGKKEITNGLVEGALTVAAKTELGGNSASGLDTLGGNIASNGNVTVSGEHNLQDGKVDGSFTVTADSEAHAGLGQQAGASVNVETDGTVTVAGKKVVGKDGKLDGSLTINEHTDLEADTANSLTKLEGTTDSHGVVTIAGKKQLGEDGKVDGSLTVTADSEAHAGLGHQAGASVNVETDGTVTVAGKKVVGKDGKLDGSLTINEHSDLEADTANSLTKLEGTTDSHGVVTIAGKKELENGKVDGSLTVTADSEAHAGLGQQAGASVNVETDGTVTVAGKKVVGKDGKLDGSLTINEHSDLEADTANSLTKLEGTTDSHGVVTIAGKKELENGKVDGSLTVTADSEAHAGLGQQAGASVNVETDGTVTVAGKKVVGKDGKLDGSLTINEHTDLEANTANSLTKLEGTTDAHGVVTIAGKKELENGKVDGSLTVTADSEAHAGLGQQAGASVNVETDGTVTVAAKKVVGKDGKLDGSLTINEHTDLEADTANSLTKLEGTTDTHGVVTIAGKKELENGKVDGSLTVTADSEAHAGLGQQAGASVNVETDGTVTVAGKKVVGKDGKLDGSLTINEHTDLEADTANSLTKLEGSTDSHGVVTIAGKKQLGEDGKVDGSLTVTADSEAHAGLGQQAGASVNVETDGTVTVAGKKVVGKDGKLDGSLTINEHTDLEADTANSLTKLEGTTDAHGVVTIAGKKELENGKVDGSLTVTADSEAHAGLGQQAGASVNVETDGTVTVAGKKVVGKNGKLDGSLTINEHTDLEADTVNSLTKLEGTTDAHGVVTIAGKKELENGKVDGSLTVTADSEAHAGLGQQAGASVNVETDGTVTVAGKKVVGKDGKLDGSLTINEHTDLEADTVNSLTKLEGTTDAHGVVTIAGKKELENGKVDGSLTVTADSEAHAGLGQQAGASVNVTTDGNLNVEGTTDEVAGSLGIDTHTETAANTSEGLTKLEGTGSGNGHIDVNTGSSVVSVDSAGSVSAGVNQKPTVDSSVTTSIKPAVEQPKKENKVKKFFADVKSFFQRIFGIK